jgi:hypothetical protein
VPSNNEPVRLPRLIQPSGPLGLGLNTTTPKSARRALAKALERQKKRLTRSEAEVVAVQLLGQVTSAAEWPKLRAYWERRNPSGVGAWPRRLEPDDYALNLWPLPAGRVGRAAGLGGDVRKRQPRDILCTPGLTRFNPNEENTDMTTGLAVAAAIWLDGIGMKKFQALRLAPPVLEAWAPGGRLISRTVEDFGLEWSLPAADGI